MGISYNTYVGPYARCTVGTVMVTKSRRACLRKGCANHERDRMTDGFCSLCGSPVGDVLYTEDELAVDQWEGTEAIDERLTAPGGDAYANWMAENRAHIYLPNIATHGRDYHLDTRVDFDLIGLEPGQPVQEIAAFVAQFRADLDTLAARYGAENVRVLWGIVQHYY